MERGEKIRELRKKKGLNQVDLANLIGLTQGYISDIERGRQPPSPEFVSKISGPLEISKEDLSFLLVATTAKGLEDIWPANVRENREVQFGIRNTNQERRLPENTSKRKIINKVIKILDSENDTVKKALKANIEAFLYALGSDDSDLSLEDKGGFEE